LTLDKAKTNELWNVSVRLIRDIVGGQEYMNNASSPYVVNDAPYIVNVNNKETYQNF